MKFVLSITLICTLIVVNNAALSQGNFKDPKHPGKCVVENVILSPGEEAQDPNQCGRMLCDNDGWVEFQTCGSVMPPEGYKLGEPVMPNAKYPDCCERHFVRIE